MQLAPDASAGDVEGPYKVKNDGVREFRSFAEPLRLVLIYEALGAVQDGHAPLHA